MYDKVLMQISLEELSKVNIFLLQAIENLNTIALDFYFS